MPDATHDMERRIRDVREGIDRAAREAGRDPSGITLVAVSKGFPREAVDIAQALGLTQFGENRVQEAQAKYPDGIPAGVIIRLIGNLQTNKAKTVPGLFATVDTVDREAIVTALDRAAAKAGATLDVLIQVNVAGEAQKSGCRPDEAAAILAAVAATSTLTPRGLMTIAPIDATGDALRAVFRDLRHLRDHLRETPGGDTLTELSMGMSGDYADAIAEGATQVRIGSAIFGSR